VPEAGAHLKASGRYLVEELRVRRALKDAIASANPERIADAGRAFSSVTAFASELQSATDILVATYAISSEDALRFKGH